MSYTKQKLFKIKGGTLVLTYHRPEAEPRAVQIDGYWHDNSGSEIELDQRTYYAQDSDQNALENYLIWFKRTHPHA
jgi:hypothetical protein